MIAGPELRRRAIERTEHEAVDPYKAWEWSKRTSRGSEKPSYIQDASPLAYERLRMMRAIHEDPALARGFQVEIRARHKL